jgi:hypothetical protein
VISDAEGRVLANVLQQDLDDPIDLQPPPRYWPQPTAVRSRESPKA